MPEETYNDDRYFFRIILILSVLGTPLLVVPFWRHPQTLDIMKNAFLNISVLAMLAGGLYFGIRRRPFGSPLMPPLLVFLAACILSGLFGMGRLPSMYQTAQYALAVILYTLVFRQKDEWMKEAYLRLIIFISLIVNVSILLEASTDVSRYLPMYKNSATFRTIGHVFAFTLFSYPISLFALFRWQSSLVRIVAATNIIIGSFVLFLLWGINSVFWLFLIVPVGGAVLLYARLRAAEKSKAAGVLATASMLAVLAAGIAAGIGFYHGLIALTAARKVTAENDELYTGPGGRAEFFTGPERAAESIPPRPGRGRMVLEDVHETPEEFFDIEKSDWTTKTIGWIFSKRPVLGFGPGTEKAYTNYYLSSVDVPSDDEGSEYGYYRWSLANDYTRLFAESGVVGIAAILWLATIVVIRFVRTYRRALKEGNGDFFLDIAYLAGLGAIALYGIRHYSILTPTGFMLAATGAAFLDLGENPPTLFLVKLKKHGLILFLGFALAALAALLPFYGGLTFEKAMGEATLADGLYDRDNTAEYEDAVDRARILFKQAMIFNPTLERIAHEYADFLYRSPAVVPRAEVEKVLEKGLRADPYNQDLLARICEVKAQLGSPDAQDWFRKRLAFRPGDARVRLWMVEHYVRQGDMEQAFDYARETYKAGDGALGVVLPDLGAVWAKVAHSLSRENELPDDPYILLGLAIAYFESNETDKTAEIALNLHKNPGFWDGLTPKYREFAAKVLVQALAETDQLELLPEGVEFRLALAEKYYYEEDFDAAAETAREALEAENASGKPHALVESLNLLYARSLYALGEADSIGSSRAEIAAMGRVFLENGDYASAKAILVPAFDRIQNTRVRPDKYKFVELVAAAVLLAGGPGAEEAAIEIYKKTIDAGDMEHFGTYWEDFKLNVAREFMQTR